jgi:hypothetical protein
MSRKLPRSVIYRVIGKIRIDPPFAPAYTVNVDELVEGIDCWYSLPVEIARHQIARLENVDRHYAEWEGVPEVYNWTYRIADQAMLAAWNAGEPIR